MVEVITEAFVQLTQSSVTFFFLIRGQLFFLVVLNLKEKCINGFKILMLFFFF